MFQGNTHGSVLFSTMVPQTLTGDYEPPYNMKSTSASSTVESLKKKKERERDWDGPSKVILPIPVWRKKSQLYLSHLCQAQYFYG